MKRILIGSALVLTLFGAASTLAVTQAPAAYAIPGDENIIDAPWVQCTRCGGTMEGPEQYGHLQTCPGCVPRPGGGGGGKKGVGPNPSLQ